MIRAPQKGSRVHPIRARARTMPPLCTPMTRTMHHPYVPKWARAVTRRGLPCGPDRGFLCLGAGEELGQDRIDPFRELVVRKM